MAEEKKSDIAKQVKAGIRQKQAEEEKKEKKPAEAHAEAPAEAKPVPAEKPKPEAKAKPEAKPEEKIKEEKLREEKIVTVSLRRAWKTPRTRRARAAVKVLKRQLERHLKKPVKIDGEVNRKIWERGITNPPHRLKLKIRVFEDAARVFLA